MQLLILGGTVFLGRTIAETALDRGHQLTLFNRGQTAPEVLRDVEQIHGDREQDLRLLAGRQWDAVIDTSGYVPRIVQAAAEALHDSVAHYTFVSSISAYGTFNTTGLSEDSPAAPLPADITEDVERLYGELKAECERRVQATYREQVLVIRPGLIVGPRDPTERFTKWVRRFADGGVVRAPDAPEQPVQLIDVRDLSDWVVRLVERRQSGVFNATGPATPLTFNAMIERIAAATGGNAQIDWVAEEQLTEEGVETWSDMPLWLDLPRNPDYQGFLAVDIGRALDAGLTFRSLEETVQATMADAAKPAA